MSAVARKEPRLDTSENANPGTDTAPMPEHDAAATPPTPSTPFTPTTGDTGGVLDVAGTLKPLQLPELLQIAARESGKSFQQIVGEMARLAFGPGKISTEEYFSLRLFDDALLGGVDKRAFIGFRVSRDVWGAVNHREDWYGVMDDKLAIEAMMTGYGFAVPRTAAVFSDGPVRPGFRHLGDRAALQAFLAAGGNYPMFAKPLDAFRSLGTMDLEGYDAETGCLAIPGGRSVPLDAFIDDVIANYSAGYLFQKRLTPHRDVRAMCGNRLACVRIITLWGDQGPEVFRTAWKIPAGANVADNYWRGNILAQLDPDSGAIRSAWRPVRIWSERLDAHPDTGVALIGREVPGWSGIVDLALDCARAFPGVPLIGWDIAPTDDGAVLIEPNHTPDFMLPQIADTCGVMDERLKSAMARSKRAGQDRLKKLKAFDRRESHNRFRQVFAR